MIVSFILVVGLIFIDFLTKLLASNLLTLNVTKVIIPKILEFFYITNTGASGGSYQDGQLLFMIVTIFALAIFGYMFSSVNLKSKKVFSFAVILFIAGTFGNAIDRVFRDGHVIDFIHIPLLTYIHDIFDFTFNLADLYLNIAIVLFIIDILFLESKRNKKNEVVNHETPISNP